MAHVMHIYQQQAAVSTGGGDGGDDSEDPSQLFNRYNDTGHYVDCPGWGNIYLSNHGGNIGGNNEIDYDLADNIQNYNSEAHTSDSKRYGSVGDYTQNVGNSEASRMADPIQNSVISSSRHSVNKIPGPQNSAD